jgi:hypothetical protein
VNASTEQFDGSAVAAVLTILFVVINVVFWAVAFLLLLGAFVVVGAFWLMGVVAYALVRPFTR